jgi:hypothetical protein
MAKHRNTVSVRCRVQNAASTCNAGGSSSLHTRMNAAARLMQPLRCAATHLKTSHRFLHRARVKHTAHASTGTTSAAHSTARAQLQQHLHFLHATPRHTLNHHLIPAPRHVRHVRTGRRSDQSLAHERHTAEHEAHSPTRRTFRDSAAEGRQRWLPTVMRKKPLVVLEKLERAAHDDLTAKLRGRLQYAVGNEGKKHGSAVEAIRK